MRVRQFWPRAMALGLSVTILAACTGGSDTDEQPTSTDTATEAGAADGTDAEEPTGGGTVTVAEPLSITTMDPIADPGALNGTTVWSTVYETLVVVEADGSISPRLATDWSVNDDATEFEFQLREGVVFHDGTDFDAEDVVFSLERARDEAVPQNAQRFENMESVEADGELSVRIVLAETEPLFLNTLGDPTGLGAAILPSEAADRDDLDSNPVGTGPLAFESHEPNTELVLTPNDDYWDEIDIAYDELRVRFIEEDQSQIAALQAGEIDVAKTTNAVTYRSVENDDSLEVAEYEGNMYWLNFSNTGPTENLDVNRAVMLAIDRDAIAQGAFLGQAEPTSTVLPSYEAGLHPADLPNYERDVEGARSLLAEAGYPDGLDLTFTFPSLGDAWSSIGEVLQASLAEVGINLTLEPLEQSVWLTRFLDRDYDLSMTNQVWYANPVRYVLPRDQWQAPVDEIAPEIGNALAEFQSTSDADARDEIFHNIQEMEAEMAYPFVGLVASYSHVIYSPDRVASLDASDLTRDVRRGYYLSLTPA